MRLDPVYLVAPEPQKTCHSSRRTFLLFGVGGLLLGGGVGFLVGRRAGGQPAVADAPAGAGSKARNLDWARRLARGPVEELYEKLGSYLTEHRHASSDSVLWSGLERVADHIIENPRLERRESRAGMIVGFLEDVEGSAPASAERLRRELQRILR